MKRIILGIAVIIFAFGIGIYATELGSAYIRYVDLQNEVNVISLESDNTYHYQGKTWQDNNHPCGKPRQSLFDDDKYLIVDNPLCNYSADLHEIPTVNYDELARLPSFYDSKIIRVRGRFYLNPKNEYKSSLFMVSELQSSEKTIEFNSPFDLITLKFLSDFIELNSPETNCADVSLIINFLDVSDNPSVLEINNNNTLQMLVLHVEDIKSVNSKK